MIALIPILYHIMGVKTQQILKKKKTFKFNSTSDLNWQYKPMKKMLKETLPQFYIS